MRGIQRTNANGLASFTTIYPGWYPGRTVHIHVRVYLGGNVVHTGQLFFPDALTDAVYRRAPYNSAARADDAQRDRLDLPERRLEVDAAGSRRAGTATSAASRWESAARSRSGPNWRRRAGALPGAAAAGPPRRRAR